MKHQKEVLHFNIPIDLSMYDKLPYKLNPAICTKENVSLTSGNIIKRYNVKMDEEKHIIEPIPFDFDNVTNSTDASTSNDTSEHNIDTIDTPSDINTTDSEDNSTITTDVDAHYSEE